jgi:gluconokinase
MDTVKRGLYVVMGVSGSGKSVIGAAFARALGVNFVEGDDYHTAVNVARMSSGVPLTDDDRAEWLRLLAARVREAKHSGAGLIVSCSALKRAYRDILRGAASELRFIFLQGPRALLLERLASRHGHYMPPALLESQLETLEEPAPDERAWVCDIGESPENIVAALMARVSA